MALIALCTLQMEIIEKTGAELTANRIVNNVVLNFLTCALYLQFTIKNDMVTKNGG